MKKGKKTDKYRNTARELKKIYNMKVTAIPIATGALGLVTKGIGTGTGGLGNKKISGDYPNDSSVEISQNTKKCPGDFRRLAITEP